jgi:predicted Zn-dependent protease with MMP-like domain
VSGRPPTVRHILVSALAALAVGLGIVSLVFGFSPNFGVRALQALAVFAAGAAIIGGAAVLVMIRLAGWRDPVSEAEFDAIVERAERMASEGAWAQEGGWAESDHERVSTVKEEDEGALALDPYDDQDFGALVRAAVDDLPLEFHRALEHVAIVVSDGGRARRAYGLYQGDTVARDFFHDRIVIFRDTLVRDFGHDPALLRAQVTRTVRHELAHHLGWDEKGVRGLGL